MKTGKYVKFITRVSLTPLRVLIFNGQKREESCRIIKYNYGNETFLLQPVSKEDILNSKKAFLKLSFLERG